MGIELRKAAVTDGMDIYEMLQELPANENGFINSAAGMQFEEYKEWLKGKVLAAEQIGIVDGWKVPQSTFWLFEDSRPVGYGNLRHFLTEKLLEYGLWSSAASAEISGIPYARQTGTEDLARSCCPS